VSQWADSYRKLSPESSAEPGAWKTSRAEYQRGIMDALGSPDVTTVVFMKSAQVGATELLNNVVGYYIAQDPAPILLLQPTLEMAQAWSKDRLAPMLRDSPALHGAVKDPKAKNSGNTMLHKSFAGGHITMAGANSPAGLASRPIRVLLGDEVDRYPVSAGSEGDPVNLARKRTTTFWNRKILLTSTPTVKGASRIEMEFEESDKRYYFVPCPHCDEYQRLKWENVQWPKNEPMKAQYCCDKCGCLFSDVARIAAIRKGHWKATGPFNGRAGFHINELYSPWSSMADMAVNFLEAKKSPETLKTFINTSLGETWEEPGESVDTTGLLGRREQYDDVPEGAIVLTAGVDVQANYFAIEVVAWGQDEQSWNVDYFNVPGDTSKAEAWQDLDDALLRKYTHAGGTEMHIAATGIDSGFRTQLVYDFVKSKTGRRLYALKGVSGAGRPVVQLSRGKAGNKQRRAVDLYTIGVDDAKGIVFARLKVSDPGPGYCHFPTSRDEEYFDQLTGEKIVTRFVKGFPKREWVKTRARNEALDCRVMSYATLKILNPVWSAIAGRMSPKKEVVEEEPQVRPSTRKVQRPKRKRGNFVTSW